MNDIAIEHMFESAYHRVARMHDYMRSKSYSELSGYDNAYYKIRTMQIKLDERFVSIRWAIRDTCK